MSVNLVRHRHEGRVCWGRVEGSEIFDLPGDVVEASIRTDDGAIDLGRQRNRVVAG